jgi:multidrug transporter EmrE-like cation transporter
MSTPLKTPTETGESRMSLGAFAFLFLIALCVAAANLLLRESLARVAPFALSLQGILQLVRQPMFIGGIVVVGISGLLWCRALSAGNLTTIYPLFVGLTFILITIGSTYFRGEKLSLNQMIGATVILGGIFVATRS